MLSPPAPRVLCPPAPLVDQDFTPHFELALYRFAAEGRALTEDRRNTGAADPGAWLKLADGWEPGREPAAFAAAWLRTWDDLKTARPLRPNMIRHRLSACIWPDACLPPADRFFKRARPRR
jgi:hypothetical protein